MKNHSLLASTITGIKVENPQGDNIGKIDDLMIDLQTGEILYAVLSHNGFLEMDHNCFAIPMQALQFSDRDYDIIKVAINKEVLETAPGFNKRNWPEHSSEEFTNAVYTHYGYERSQAPQI